MQSSKMTTKTNTYKFLISPLASSSKLLPYFVSVGCAVSASSTVWSLKPKNKVVKYYRKKVRKDRSLIC